MFVHEDDRRTLYEFGNCKVFKALIAKSPGDMGCVVGDHHHRNKDESFLLLSGFAMRVVVGDREWRDVSAPCHWDVPRGTYHLFHLSGDSVLIGTATEEFDPADEIAGRP